GRMAGCSGAGARSRVGGGAVGRAQPLLRGCSGGRPLGGRELRRRGGSSPWGFRDGRPVIRVRRAVPTDAAALVALAESVGREEGRWILASDGWRSVSDERRFLRNVQSHSDAAVYVAEDDGHVIARLSLARDPHPASRHVADLGLMVAAGHRRRGIGNALL